MPSRVGTPMPGALSSQAGSSQAARGVVGTPMRGALSPQAGSSQAARGVVSFQDPFPTESDPGTPGASPSTSFSQRRTHELAEMETTRINPLADSFNVSDDDSSEDLQPHKVKLDGERILYEGFAVKQSRWMGRWRRRWMVLTPSRLLFLRSERGYWEAATETYSIQGICGARILEADEIGEAFAKAAPFACFFATEVPEVDALEGGASNACTTAGTSTVVQVLSLIHI